MRFQHFLRFGVVLGASLAAGACGGNTVDGPTNNSAGAATGTSSSSSSGGTGEGKHLPDGGVLCTANGRDYTPGEAFSNGCADCVCAGNGVVECGKRACIDAGAASCDTYAAAAEQKLDAFIASNRACEHDEDCATVEDSTACFDACTRTIAKAAVGDYEQLRAQVSTSACGTFAADGCSVVHPPCAPPLPPKCVHAQCQ